MRVVFVLLLSSLLLQSAALPVPPENNKLIECFEDGFNGSTRRPEWIAIGDAGDIYLQTNGVIRMAGGGGFANHLVVGLTYDGSTQEVLARIRVLDTDWGDLSRGGVGVGVNPTTSNGINFHFRYMDLLSQINPGAFGQANPGVDPFLEEGNPSQGLVTSNVNAFNHMELHNDGVAWGPELQFPWQKQVFYWVRLRQEVNMNGGVEDVFAKMWRADGIVAEPVDWQVKWNYTPTSAPRNGLAGLVAGTLNGYMELECDYILVKAAGLPLTRVGAPRILAVDPAPNLMTSPAAEGLHFQVVSPYEIEKVIFTLNGVDESARLIVTGNASEKNYSYLELEPEKLYDLTIEATSTSGVKQELAYRFGTLRAVTELRLLDPAIQDGKMTFAFAPLPGKNHRVQFRTSWEGSWSEASTATLTPDNERVRVLDALQGSSGYYRILAE